MFDLRNDLKLYTSIQHSNILKLVAKGKRVGSDHVFDVRIRLVNKQASYGKELRFEYTPVGITSEELTSLIEEMDLQFLISSSGYLHVAKANPTKTYTDFVNGTTGILSVPDTKVQELLQANLPATRMNKLLFDKDSHLARITGKYRGWSKRLSAEKKARMIYLAWALYGLDLNVSLKREELYQAIDKLQPTDFGIKDCDDMWEILEKLGNVNAEGFQSLVDTTKALDAMIAKHKGRPIERNKPRSKLLRAVYDTITGYGATGAAS